MLIYDVMNKEKVHQIISNDLRNFGVKYRFKKNCFKVDKPQRGKYLVKKVFKTPLSYQPLDVVSLSSGGIVHVPVFVSQASTFLEKYITQEGLFRKGGSQARQRELIARLDNGGALTDGYNAIDVANCLKTFFRDLPEPLIPYTYHDLFVHCVMIKSCHIQALLLACILLPPYHLNTLAFLMEFLKKVSFHEKQNRMSIDNLAKVIAPNIMPLQDVSMSAVHNRLESHLIIVKILIENAQSIGVLPDHITQIISAETSVSTENELNLSDSRLHAKQKKKKHRSGSLTRMFNGLKKIVGKSGSLEDEPTTLSDQQLPSNTDLLNMHSTKSSKKRKVLESAESQSTKKKRISDRMDKPKKGRLSLDRFQPKNKMKLCDMVLEETGLSKTNSQRDYDMFTEANVNLSDESGEQVSLLKDWDVRPSRPSVYLGTPSTTLEIDNSITQDSEQSFTKPKMESTDLDDEQEEYVKIPKSEYEDIKNRVSAIETRISQEFGCIGDEESYSTTASSVNKVQAEYEKTLEEASIESTISTDHLAKKLGKELKIRRSAEHKIIRSPSARRIGNLRRRSQEKLPSKRVSRTASWHANGEHQLKLNQQLNNTSKYYTVDATESCMKETNIQLDLLYKQLNTNSLINRELTPIKQKLVPSVENQINLGVRRASSFHGNEFICNSLYENDLKKSGSQQNILPKEEGKENVWKDADCYFKTASRMNTPISQTGRASVAKIRAQNAGMVLAKARLFDETTVKSEALLSRRCRTDTRNQQSTTPEVSHMSRQDVEQLSATRSKVSRRKKTKSLKNNNHESGQQHKTEENCCYKLPLKLNEVNLTDNIIRIDSNIQIQQKGNIEKSPSTITKMSLNTAEHLHMNSCKSTNSALSKTPVIKKPLTMKTPKSAKALSRGRPVIDTRRTPLKAVPQLATPQRESPKSVQKNRGCNKNVY